MFRAIREKLKEIFNPWLQKKFIGDVVSLQIGTAGLMFIYFVTGIVIARFLHVEDLGTYALVIALLNTIYFFIDIGSGLFRATATELSTAYASRDREKMLDTIAYTLKQYLFLCSLISGVGFLISPYVSGIVFGNTRIGLLARPLFLVGFLNIPYDSILRILQAMQKMKLFALIENGYWGFRFIFVVIALLGDFGIQGVIYSWVVTAILWAFISYILYLNLSMKNAPILPRLSDIYKRIWKVKSKGFFRFGLSITIDKNITNLYINLPIILLGRFFSSSEVGYFKIAIGIISLPILFLESISPKVVGIFPEYILKGEMEKLKRFFKNISLSTGLISIFITSLLMVFAPYFVNLLYGKEYYPAVRLIYMLGLYLIIVGFTTSLEPLYRTLKKVNLAIMAKVITLVILFFPGWMLIRNAGNLGAAFLLSVLYLVSSFIILFLIYPLLKSVNFSYE